MVFLDRSRSREVAHLEWRIRLFGVGAILAILGMYFEMGWMITVAIGVLLVGFFLRFLPDGGQDDGAVDPDDPVGFETHDHPDDPGGPEDADTR